MVCPFRLSRLVSSCRAAPRSFSNSLQAKRKVQRVTPFSVHDLHTPRRLRRLSRVNTLTSARPAIPRGAPPAAPGGAGFTPATSPFATRFASWKNHSSGTRAAFGPCLARSAKYSFTSMTVAGALLTLQRCRNARISRRYSVCWASAQPVFASADFHVGNDTASVSGLISRVQLYAASASTVKSCTQPSFTFEATAQIRLLGHPAIAALSAAE